MPMLIIQKATQSDINLGISRIYFSITFKRRKTNCQVCGNKQSGYWNLHCQFIYILKQIMNQINHLIVPMLMSKESFPLTKAKVIWSPFCPSLWSRTPSLWIVLNFREMTSFSAVVDLGLNLQVSKLFPSKSATSDPRSNINKGSLTTRRQILHFLSFRDNHCKSLIHFPLPLCKQQNQSCFPHCHSCFKICHIQIDQKAMACALGQETFQRENSYQWVCRQRRKVISGSLASPGSIQFVF